MNHPRSPFFIIAFCAVVSACGQSSQTAAPPAAAPPPRASPPAAPDSALVSIEGKLLSGIFAIGAETTGWAIEQAQPDGSVVRTEIECSGVMKDAGELQGKMVRAYGTWETREYVERGTIRVLIVARIEAVP